MEGIWGNKRIILTEKKTKHLSLRAVTSISRLAPSLTFDLRLGIGERERGLALLVSWEGVAWCYVVWGGVAWCYMAGCGEPWCSKGVVWCSVIRCGVVW